MNKPILSRHIDVELWKSGIMLFICDKETGLKKIKKYLPEDYQLDLFEGKCITVGRYNPIVWVNSKSKNLISVLSHELLHATFDILILRGVPITYENSEVINYTHQFLMEKCMKLLK